jgi:hypothetical protein
MAKFPRAAAAQDSAQVIFHEASESIKAAIQESERAKQRERSLPTWQLGSWILTLPAAAGWRQT